MTIKEKLEEEFKAAVLAVLGNNADKEFGEDYVVDGGDIDAIAHKVKFYLDL